jgi:outer membrane immunogenic protein
MRRLLVGLGLMGGLLSPALAADYDIPILRGSEPVAPIAPVTTVGPATFTRWSGFYFGGVFSYSNATVDFSNASQPLLASSLQGLTLEELQPPSQLVVLGRSADSAFGGGGFLGYNTQWQDLIIGVEATYTHTNLNTTAPSLSVGRNTTAGSAAYNFNVTGSGNLDLTDYGTARARAGYVVGNLLPYGFIGVAVGRASYSVTSDIAGQQNTALVPSFPCDTRLSTCVDFNYPNSAGQSNALLWGFSVGGGLDWAVTRNVFLRGEFEFIQFAPITNINVPVVNGRLGVGYKF